MISTLWVTEWFCFSPKNEMGATKSSLQSGAGESAVETNLFQDERCVFQIRRKGKDANWLESLFLKFTNSWNTFQAFHKLRGATLAEWPRTPWTLNARCARRNWRQNWGKQREQSNIDITDLFYSWTLQGWNAPIRRQWHFRPRIERDFEVASPWRYIFHLPQHDNRRPIQVRY